MPRFRLTEIGRGRVVEQNAWLAAFIQRQLCIDRIPQTDIKIAVVGEFEVNLWTVIAILINPRLANHPADEFFTVDHMISRLEWSHENISITLEWRILW